MEGTMSITVTGNNLNIQTRMKNVGTTDKAQLINSVCNALDVVGNERAVIFDLITSGVLGKGHLQDVEEEQSPFDGIEKMARDMGLDVEDIGIGTCIGCSPEDMYKLLEKIMGSKS